MLSLQRCCDCGGGLSRATRINIDGEHPFCEGWTETYKYGERAGTKYFGGFKSGGLKYYLQEGFFKLIHT